MDKNFQNQEGCQIYVLRLVYFPWKSGSLLQNQEGLAALHCGALPLVSLYFLTNGSLDRQLGSPRSNTY